MTIIFKKRKHGLMYHRIGYCCGEDKYFPQFLLFLIFAFRKNFYWTCPVCGKVHSVKFSWHTMDVHDDYVKQVNKKVDKKEHYRNG